MRHFIVFRILEDGVESDDIFEVNDTLYEIMHDTLKDIIEERPMPGEEEMGRKIEDCPLCGGKTEQLIECPECGARGCAERCHPAGVGCICPICEEKKLD